MKKNIINIILIVVFLSLITALIFLCLADSQFNAAKSLEASYLWQKAERKYQLAIILDPFNSECLSGYADFLRLKGVYQKDAIARFKKAEKLYERALKINPRRAEYALGLGKVQIELFLKDKKNYAKKLNAGLGNFKKALKEDPNGFNISYSVGYACIPIWKNLDNEWKELVLDRLQYVIGIRSDYFAYIYPRLWEATKDIRLIQRIRPKEPQEERGKKLKKIIEIKQGTQHIARSTNTILMTEWQGVANDGKNIYIQGNMYWNGTIYAPVYVPAGDAVVKIQALGQKVRGIYPYMIVELDGEEIGEIFVDSAEWKEYRFAISSGIPRLRPSTSSGLRSGLPSVAVPEELKVLSVTFLNDYCDAKEDRNLIVGEARIVRED